MVGFVKKIANWLFDHIPGKRYIVFESIPLFADNTRPVYEEMIRRGIQEKYKLIWVTIDDKVEIEIPHAKILRINDKRLLSKIYMKWVFLRAVCFISCNWFLSSYRKGQYSMFLSHGLILKRTITYYTIPERMEEITGISTHFLPDVAKDSNSDINKWRILGFPRNDVLFHSDVNVHALFPETDFNKMVYWMPTYRQHARAQFAHSAIAMPILYNEEIAEKINACAKECGVLIIVKPHFVQDVSLIKKMNLSHLQFIDEKFLVENKIKNYALLGKADAMITDYSSVYCDYLLLNRPMGLCWDDFDDYKEHVGFSIDPDIIMVGGEKIYNADDMCGFIQRLSEGTDLLKEERTALLNQLHDHKDDKSTERVVNHIMDKLKAMESKQ